MISKFFKAEILKTEHTEVRKTLFIFPILVIIFNLILFTSTGYLTSSIVNQWSFIWFNLFLALEIGFINRNEKKSHYNTFINTFNINFKYYELSRILNGILLSLVASIVIMLLLFITYPLSKYHVSLLNYTVSIFGIFLSSLWMIPLYFFISRKSNIFTNLIIALIGAFLRLNPDSILGKVDPFNWSAIFTVPWIKMHINGLPFNQNSPYVAWPIFASIVLLVVFTIIDMHDFNKRL